MAYEEAPVGFPGVGRSYTAPPFTGPTGPKEEVLYDLSGKALSGEASDAHEEVIDVDKDDSASLAASAPTPSPHTIEVQTAHRDRELTPQFKNHSNSYRQSS